MEFPEEVGICKSGHQLFTVIPAEKEILESNDNSSIEKIGDVVGCVNIFEPHFGSLIKNTNKKNNESTYKINFNTEAVNEFNKKRISGAFKNGCYVKELKNELKNNIEVVK